MHQFQKHPDSPACQKLPCRPWPHDHPHCDDMVVIREEHGVLYGGWQRVVMPARCEPA